MERGSGKSKLRSILSKQRYSRRKRAVNARLDEKVNRKGSG